MVRVLTTHWVIVAVSMLLTVVCAAGLVGRVTPEFEANATLLLLTPNTTETPEGPITQNPLENPNRVAVLATALIDVAQSREFAEQLYESGLQAKYEVSFHPSGTGAILSVRTEASDSAVATDDRELLIEALRAEVADIQENAGIDSKAWIRINVLPVSAASALTGSKVRVLIITLVLGTVLSYVLALIADSIYGDRRILHGWFGRRGKKASKADPTAIILEPGERKPDDPDVDERRAG